MGTGGLSLAEMLREHKSVLVAKWLRETLRVYPESSVKFLTRQRDAFRNPVGHTLHRGLSVLFEGVVQSSDVSALQPALDDIVRIQAVQGVSASQAADSIFHLKRIIRTEVREESRDLADELRDLDERIDALALLAFDLFAKCREQILEIKANEGRRMSFLSEKMVLTKYCRPL